MEELDYKKLFTQSPTAIAYHKIILDGENRPCDYEFLEVNSSFEKLTGLEKENIVNKKVREVFPEVESGEFDWIAFYGDIALNGGRREFEAFFKPLNSWLRVSVHSPQQGYFITHLRELDKNRLADTTEVDHSLDIDIKRLDYQMITDRVKELSGAKYVACNIYDKEEKIYETRAISGDEQKIQEGLSMLGIDLFNWKWSAEDFGDFKEKDEQIISYQSLNELVEGLIPKKIILKLQQLFGLGNSYFFKIIRDDFLSGYFVIMMPEDKDLENRELLKLYSRQLTLLIESRENKKLLSQANQRLKLAMEAAEHTFWEWNLENNKAYFSPNFYKMLGYKDDQLQIDIDSAFKIIHPEDKKETLKIIEKAVEELEPFAEELRVKCKNGGWKWVEVRGKSYQLDPRGKAKRILGINIDIDQKKKQEEALKKSREKFSRLSEEAPIGILSADRNGNIDYANSKMIEILGSPGLIETKKINLLKFPLLIERGFSQKIEKCMTENEPATYELNYSTKWGKNIWLRVHLTPRHEDDKVTGVQLIVDEITEKKEIQDRLKLSERNFRTFFESMDDMIFISDYRGEISHTNHLTIEKLGYSKEELAAMSFADIYIQKEGKEIQQLLADMAAGKIMSLESKDGRLIPSETRIWFGKWNGKEVIFAIAKDVSRQQEALQKFNKLFNNNPALMTVNTLVDFSFIEVNSSFLSKMGYSKEEIIGRNCRELELFADKAKRRKIIKKIIKEGSVNNIELKLLNKRDEVLELLFSGEIIESQGQQFILTVMTDITVQKRVEEELVKTNQKLQESMDKANKMAVKAEKANELKSQFLANMSHEIRTPLNIIMGYTELLAKDLEEDNYKRYIKSIRSAGDSLLDQVNDILDMSKIEAGIIEINYEYIDLAALLENITAIFADKVKAKGLDFQLKMDNLPPLVKMDEFRFRQIMINLLDNAVKFTKSGHIFIGVYCRPVSGKGNNNIKLRIIVQDTGIGIKAEKQEEIFKAFSQENAESTREFGGTGLGLSITRRLVDMMDGQISLQSTAGKGSVFKIEFSSLESASGNEIKLSENKPHFEKQFRNATVLVVDDEKLNRELLKDRLNRKGINVIEAAHGKEAYQLSRDKEFDLIIMDLKMPVMDGYQALARIQEDQSIKDLPVVALTAAATEEEQKNANQAGFDDFICKPLLEEDLLKIINNFLEEN